LNFRNTQAFRKQVFRMSGYRQDVSTKIGFSAGLDISIPILFLSSASRYGLPLEKIYHFRFFEKTSI